MNQVKKALGQLLEPIAELIARNPGKRIEMAIVAIVTLVSVGVFSYVAFGSSYASFGFIQSVELRALDAMFKARGKRPPDPRIVIVGMDENTVRKIGQFPIPRDAYAKLIDKLHEGGAKVVAFDVAFPTPEKNSALTALRKLEADLGDKPPANVIDKIKAIEATSDNDAILADSLKKAGNVVLGHSFDASEAATVPLEEQKAYYKILWGQPWAQVHKVGSTDFKPGDAFGRHDGYVVAGVLPNMTLLAEAAASYGAYTAVVDHDGTVRRAALLYYFQQHKSIEELGGDFFTSLPVQALRLYEGIKDQATDAAMGEVGLVSMDLGPHRIKPNSDGTVLINYAGPYKTYPHYSMADVIDGTVPASTFQDKIVFLGATAQGIGDMRSTPFQKQDEGYMGVETHANVLDNLLHSDEPSRTFIRRGFNEEMIDLVVILLFGAGMGWVFTHVKPLYSTLSVIAVLILYIAAVRFAFGHMGMWLFLVIPCVSLVLNYGGVTSYRMIFEEREKRKVRKTFARYVSPGVIGLIEKDPKKYFKAGGETRELTILFSDIRSFTTIAESMTADELVALLNEYLGEMTDILFNRWGTLDKYIGDAVMAFWGSPFPQDDHFIRACACALDMSKRLEELNLKWEAMGKKPLEIGIGINTGLVSVGNMGSEKRFAWTVMGDPVNLASRLEGQNKEYHTTRIISEFTWAKVREHYVCRPLDRIRVKGKTKPVEIYELMAFGKEAASYADLLAKWNDAQAAYYRKSWDEAIQKFEALLSRYPDDGPSHAFLKRSHEYRKESPAADWDGVYVAKTK